MLISMIRNSTRGSVLLVDTTQSQQQTLFAEKGKHWSPVDGILSLLWKMAILSECWDVL
ncbi:MAG: hypothetical protein IPG82_22075 [Saprospiraceae bacterium]|nr:hypothetical protein [Saprospiraceae bacterium]